MAKRDYYDVLGVAKSASADDIRKAYRKLARQYHPDVNKSADAQKRFTEVQEAYDALSDEQKRRTYDQFGHTQTRAGPPPGGAAGGAGHYTWSNVGGPGGFGGGGGAGGVDVDMEHLGSVFEAFFGGRGAPQGFGAAGRSRARGGRGRPRPAPAEEQPAVEHELNITFLTAARGGTERLRLIEDGATRTVEVKIPRGISDGARLRVGEVLLKVRVGHHPLFRRAEFPGQPEQGLDLHLDLPLTIAEAALGATVTVPTLDGMVDLTIPPGTSSGRKLRIRGRGVEDAQGKRGDLYVAARVVVPDGAKLAPEDAAALRRIAEAGPAPRAGDEWQRPPQ
ncbi:MAG: DnaJ C-terminal domain-containing protein [Phycisphaerales bacterium]